MRRLIALDRRCGRRATTTRAAGGIVTPDRRCGRRATTTRAAGWIAALVRRCGRRATTTRAAGWIAAAPPRRPDVLSMPPLTFAAARQRGWNRFHADRRAGRKPSLSDANPPGGTLPSRPCHVRRDAPRPGARTSGYRARD